MIGMKYDMMIDSRLRICFGVCGEGFVDLCCAVVLWCCGVVVLWYKWYCGRLWFAFRRRDHV